MCSNHLRLMCLAALVSMPLPGSGSEPNPAGHLPEFDAADSAAGVVTRENLLASERFWPYQVSLRAAWAPLAAGSTGVLVRAESADLARIDFGRDGIHRVPVGETDLIERANQVRRGELRKTAPNFSLALGPRLVDSAADPMRPLPFAMASAHRGFVTVFGDLDQLGSMAPALAPLAGRRDLLTIVLPLGEHPDALTWAELRRLRWPVPFVYDHLAEAYTPSLLPDDVAPPAVMLQTAEGRVLFASPWGEGVGAKLAAALEKEFGGEPAP